jgi:hypothetical protein
LVTPSGTVYQLLTVASADDSSAYIFGPIKQKFYFGRLTEPVAPDVLRKIHPGIKVKKALNPLQALTRPGWTSLKSTMKM